MIGKNIPTRIGIAGAILGILFSCDKASKQDQQKQPAEPPLQSQTAGSPVDKQIHPIVYAARNQIGITVRYDPSYVGLDYPGGDIPRDRGVCTDVIIRALRDAYNMDLQQLVHEDMNQAFRQYPDIWGLKRPDKNIDHRRVPNLMT